jgi:hypothetical protein
VDSAKKEFSLASDEFKELFGMDKEAWTKLAGWKKKLLKRKHGLF